MADYGLTVTSFPEIPQNIVKTIAISCPFALEDSHMNKLKSLCVYCGSRIGRNSTFEKTTLELADSLAENGVRLVYGGGGIGLMGVAAKRVMAKGGEVVGIIPEFLQKAEVKFEGVTEVIVTDSMHERKQHMFDMSDAFLVLPGGIGTLDETLE